MKNIQAELEMIVSKHLQPSIDRGYAVSVELDGKSLLKHYSGNVIIDGFYRPVNANTPFDVDSKTICGMLYCNTRL